MIIMFELVYLGLLVGPLCGRVAPRRKINETPLEIKQCSIGMYATNSGLIQNQKE